MFHFDQGLKITNIDLAIDARRRQPRAFVSHAHSDHMAPHELACCTPATGSLYRHRHGQRRAIRELPFLEPLVWDDVRLTTYPAGHILGSAMLLVESEGRSLLYTGDFKLSASATAEPAVVPQADVLVMESTFGDPHYRLPPRQQVIDGLLQVIRQALAVERTPVIQAYVLGKAQELTRILTSSGFRVSLHPEMAAIAHLYRACGCDVGEFQVYDGKAESGQVIVEPPMGQRVKRLPIPTRALTIAVTGWAQDPRAKFRLGVDYAFPLSDHADYQELLECIDRVSPKIIYCTHGPKSFVEHLRNLGHNAFPLAETRQLRLF